MNKLQSLVLAITLLVGSVSVATAQDYDKGVAAYSAGDYQTALREWRPLAEAGDAAAQFSLGLMYERGKGVLQDFAEAARLYRLAADQGHDNAQYFLGYLYDKGLGVPQDFTLAIKWYTLAAEQENLIAQTRLSVMYTLADGVPADLTKALKWSRLAAKNGSSSAQTNLGLIYEYSNIDLIGKNAMAHMWYNVASANGSKEAAEWRDEIAVRMAPEDISKAQEMARECMSSNYQNCGE